MLLMLEGKGFQGAGEGTRSGSTTRAGVLAGIMHSVHAWHRKGRSVPAWRAVPAVV